MIAPLRSLFGNAFRGLSAPVWWLSLTLFVNRSGTMVIFFLSVYLRLKLGFSLEQVGVVMALFGAGSMLGVFFGGNLIDRFGYYPVMFWSLLSGGVLLILLGQILDYLFLCGGFFLLGAFGEGFRPANMAAISHYSTPETYTRSVSLNRLAINLGFSIGPAIGGLLAVWNYALIFWVDGITSIGAALAVILFLENKHHTAVSPLPPDDSAPAKSSSPYRDRLYLFFLPLAALYAIAFFQFFSTMPLYYKQVQHFSEIRIGWIMALNGILVATIEMVMIYKIEKRWTMYHFISLGAGLLVVSYLALLVVGGYAWMLCITVIISFSEMFAMPFMNTLMNTRSSAANKGQYASLYVMSWSLAQILTPVIATQVISRAGYPALWIVLASFSFCVMVGIQLLGKLSRGRKQSS